jgi:membrane-bound metal-dependent hydrolase YbcI (DUF457 family)
MCMGRTHALAGAVIGASWSELVQHGSLMHTVAFAGFTGALALFPDVDQCGSSVSRSLGFFSEVIAWVIRKISGGHRHATHVICGILLTWLLALLACRFLPSWEAEAFLAVILTFSVSGFLECLHLLRSHAADAVAIAVSAAVIWRGYGLGMVPEAVLLGCSAHVVFDLMTDAGVMLAWPFSRYRFHLLPEPLAWTTGSRPETLFVAPALLLSLAALASWAVAPGFDTAIWGWAVHTV